MSPVVKEDNIKTEPSICKLFASEGFLMQDHWKKISVIKEICSWLPLWFDICMCVRETLSVYRMVAARNVFFNLGLYKYFFLFGLISSLNNVFIFGWIILSKVDQIVIVGVRLKEWRFAMTVGLFWAITSVASTMSQRHVQLHDTKVAALPAT